MIRVLIADDSDILRPALSILLECEPDIAAVGVATDGIEAVQRVEELLPDVVVMDVEMPNMDGLEATRRIKLTHPSVGVLMLSSSPSYEEASIAIGADGYLTKPFEREELYLRLRNVAARYEHIAI